MTTWIIVHNWDRFQHYGDRRSPPWIKMYLALLHDDDFQTLSPNDRSALFGLWLLYAMTNKKVRMEPRKLTQAIGQRITKATLERLNHAGFIEFSASTPLAPIEVEVEVEKKDLDLETSNDARANDREHRPYDPPRDPVAQVRKLIGRTIHDQVDLEAELSALGINGIQADELRSLVPAVPAVPVSPDDDIPF